MQLVDDVMTSQQMATFVRYDQRTTFTAYHLWLTSHNMVNNFDWFRIDRNPMLLLETQSEPSEHHRNTYTVQSYKEMSHLGVFSKSNSWLS